KRAVVGGGPVGAIRIAAPEAVHLKIDERKDAVCGNENFPSVFLAGIGAQRLHDVLPVDETGICSGKGEVFGLGMAAKNRSPLRSQRIRRIEGIGLPAVSRQIAAVIKSASRLRGGGGTVELVGGGYAELRLPLRRGEAGILGAEKSAEVGDIGIVKTFVAVAVGCALVALVDFVEEKSVDAAIDLQFANADDVLPVGG